MRFTDKNGPIELAPGEAKRIVKAAKAKPKTETLPAKIDDREQQALEAMRDINEQIVALIPNKHTGVIFVTSPQEAELAGELILKEDKAIDFIDSLWRKEAKLSYEVWTSATGKIRKYCAPEILRRDQIRMALKFYLDQQELKRQAAQEQVNKMVQKQFGSIPIAAPVVAAPKVSGFTTAEIHGARIE